jgi:hypothetical protein
MFPAGATFFLKVENSHLSRVKVPRLIRMKLSGFEMPRLAAHPTSNRDEYKNA